MGVQNVRTQFVCVDGSKLQNIKSEQLYKFGKKSLAKNSFPSLRHSHVIVSFLVCCASFCNFEGEMYSISCDLCEQFPVTRSIARQLIERSELYYNCTSKDVHWMSSK